MMHPDPSDPEAIDAAKRACLKRSFGGVLSAEEQRLVEAFLATGAGRSYLAGSEEMKRLLDGVAEVRVVTPDSGAMVAAFESMARKDLHTAQRRMPVNLMLTTGLCGLTGALCLYSGKEDLEFFGWTMLVCAALFALLFAALSRLHRRMLAADDLLRELDADRELGESPRVVTVAALVALAFVGFVSVGIAKAGGGLGVAIFAVTTAVALWITVLLERRKRQRDQELWDWWEGRRT